MRYYDLKIVDINPDGSGSGKVLQQYTSTVDGTVNGINNGAALKIEFDIPVASYNSPMGGTYIKVWGVNFSDISATKNWTNKQIQFSAGLNKGLPLANASQAGLMFVGSVLQAFGNWQGTQLSLDILVYAGGGTPNAPLNLSWNWIKGQTMEAALNQVLTLVFKKSPTINISPDLVFTENQPGFYIDLNSLGKYVYAQSLKIINNPSYNGVQIVNNQGNIAVFDNTKNVNEATQIDLNDFVSQPTWIQQNEIQMDLVLRADLQVGDFLTLPPYTNPINTAQSYSIYRNDSAFDSTTSLQIQRIRHLGNSRQLDGNSWKTVVNCTYISTGS